MEEIYNLELEKVIENIKRDNCKTVCIQLPDGLKPLAAEIQREIESKTDAKIVIYGGGCWGGCDIPMGLDKMGIDLVVQFGHAVFKRPW